MESSCIPANPDIAGIGVRVSLYAQAILVFVPVALLPFTPNPLAQAFRHWPAPLSAGATSGLAKILLDDVSVNVATVYITGIALLVATFIQAQLSDFDLYHGFVVLNLSWLNVLTIFMPVHVATMAKSEEERSRPEPMNRHGLTIAREPSEILRERWEELAEMCSERGLHAAFVLYLAAIGAYGIWLSCRLDDFGSFPDCNSLTVWVLAGRPVQATTTGLRAFLLAVSAMAVFPGVNYYIMYAASYIIILVPLLVIAIVVAATQCLLCIDLGLYDFLQARRRNTAYLFFIASYFIITITSSIIIIASTEQLIAFNKPIVGPGENDWTFGQTLALLLLAPSLWQIIVRLWTTIVGDSDSTMTSREVEERELTPATRGQATALENGEGLARRESNSVLHSQAAS